MLPNQLTGGPEWVRRDLWDIAAKAEGVSEHSDADVLYRDILRALAVERFHLRLRAEKRQVQGFALVLAKKGKPGPAIVPNRGAPHSFEVKPGASVSAKKVTMKDLADWLKWPAGAGRKVEDKTGLSGEYDFELKFTPLRTEEITDKRVSTDAPTIFAALGEQLGLKIRADQVQEDFYVIEYAQRPDAN